MIQASAAGVFGILLFAGTIQTATQTPTLPPGERQQVDAQLADRRLELVTVSALTAENKPVRDVLRSLSEMTGLVTRFDESVPELDTHCTVNMRNLRLDAALQTLLGANKIAWTVTGAKSVFLYSDTPANRQKFAESVRVFALAVAEPGVLQQKLMQLPIVSTASGLRPTVMSTRSARTIWVRATPDKMDEIAKFIAANDK
jgi:hypothetical protein